MAPSQLSLWFCVIAVLLVHESDGLKCKIGSEDSDGRSVVSGTGVAAEKENNENECGENTSFCFTGQCTFFIQNGTDNVTISVWGCLAGADAKNCATILEEETRPENATCTCFVGEAHKDMDNERFANGGVETQMPASTALRAAAVADGAGNQSASSGATPNGPLLVNILVMAVPPLLHGIVGHFLRGTVLRKY
uniref:Activin_recp domain-containing protein n=1 Tax=Globodera pallida TaxID=36090 RepID=A0A183C036_GLOPA